MKVVYYLFTFSIGLLIAFTLPNYYMYEYSMESIKTSLESKQYKDAMMLIGGYYNGEYAYQCDFDDGSGIVIFEAITIKSKTSNEETEKLEKSYCGFLYNAGGKYNVTGEDSNQSKVVITSHSDEIKNIYIIDYDSNNNDVLDTVSTLSEKSFLFFVMSNDLIDSVKKIEFIYADGSTYKKIEDLNLTFDKTFFTDATEFIEEYNRDGQSNKLDTLDKEFRAKNPNYIMSSYGNIKTKTSRTTCLIVLIYFICIYILADFLVGRHYILHLIKKIFKIKSKKEVEKESQMIGDYYCKATFKIIYDSEDEKKNLVISYKNEKDEEFVVNLIKEKNFEETKRIHAGVYKCLDDNDMLKKYDIPETVVIEGYTKLVEIRIKKDNIEN